MLLSPKANPQLYHGCELTDTNAYTTTLLPVTALPTSSITEANSVITLLKYGRNIQASYEAIRQQRLDVFAIMLRRVGKRLADSLVSKAVTVLKNVSNNSTKISVPTANFAYTSLAALYGNFTSFKMDVMLASPANVAKILTMSQMIEITSQDVTEIRLPFGTKLINCPQLDDNTIIGLDSEYALEQMQNGDVILETDKLIDRQVDSIAFSVMLNFRAFMSDAIRQLALT